MQLIKARITCYAKCVFPVFHNIHVCYCINGLNREISFQKHTVLEVSRCFVASKHVEGPTEHQF